MSRSRTSSVIMPVLLPPASSRGGYLRSVEAAAAGWQWHPPPTAAQDPVSLRACARIARVREMPATSRRRALLLICAVAVAVATNYTIQGPVLSLIRDEQEPQGHG